MSDYFVEGGDILENRLGITDPAKLKETEEDIFSDAAADIISGNNLSSKLDFTFLKNLHRLLFGKIYPFAGQIRTVNIAKADSTIPFCMADFIIPEANRIFTNLKNRDYLQRMPRSEFVPAIADLAINLNALHPFREGNGRTIRLYLQLLAKNAGFLIDFDSVAHNEIIAADRLQLLAKNAGFLIDFDSVAHNEIIAADRQAFLGNNAPIISLYEKIILPLPEAEAEQ